MLLGITKLHLGTISFVGNGYLKAGGILPKVMEPGCRVAEVSRSWVETVNWLEG